MENLNVMETTEMVEEEATLEEVETTESKGLSTGVKLTAAAGAVIIGYELGKKYVFKPLKAKGTEFYNNWKAKRAEKKSAKEVTPETLEEDE